MQPSLAVGGLCLGRFSADDCWYRARVEEVDSRDPVAPRYSLVFIDFGNRETVPADRVHPIDAQLAAVPPQALLCTLAYLKVGAAGSDALGLQAVRMLHLGLRAQRHIRPHVVRMLTVTGDFMLPPARFPAWSPRSGWRRAGSCPAPPSTKASWQSSRFFRPKHLVLIA